MYQRLTCSFIRNVVTLTPRCTSLQINGRTCSVAKVRVYSQDAGRKVADQNTNKFTGIRENILTYPNGLSLCRIALTPVLCYCILNQQYVVSLAVFAAAGLTDALDGFIARNYSNQKSVLGSVLDPLADKLLVTTSFLSLAKVGLIPVSLTVCVIVRDAILILWSIWIRHKTLPEPKSLRQFFDLTLATAEIKPSLLSKCNTGLQLCSISCAIAAPVVDMMSHPLLPPLFLATGATTLISGLGYVAAGGAYVRRHNITQTRS